MCIHTCDFLKKNVPCYVVAVSRTLSSKASFENLDIVIHHGGDTRMWWIDRKPGCVPILDHVPSTEMLQLWKLLLMHHSSSPSRHQSPLSFFSYSSWMAKTSYLVLLLFFLNFGFCTQRIRWFHLVIYFTKHFILICCFI